MHFVFMQIHLVSSIGILWKLKTEKCNVTRAQQQMNTPHTSKYVHVWTQIHINTNYFEQQCAIIHCYSCLAKLIKIHKISEHPLVCDVAPVI